jgi:hypothetical protein
VAEALLQLGRNSYTARTLKGVGGACLPVRCLVCFLEDAMNLSMVASARCGKVLQRLIFGFIVVAHGVLSF